jgi:hypothetical protein
MPWVPPRIGAITDDAQSTIRRRMPLGCSPHCTQGRWALSETANLSLRVDVVTFLSWLLRDIYLELGAKVDMNLIKKGEHREDIKNTVVHDALHCLPYFICSSCPPLTPWHNTKKSEFPPLGIHPTLHLHIIRDKLSIYTSQNGWVQRTWLASRLATRPPNMWESRVAENEWHVST